MAREGRENFPLPNLFLSPFSINSPFKFYIIIIIIINNSHRYLASNHQSTLLALIFFFKLRFQLFYVQLSGNSRVNPIPIGWSVGPSLFLSLRTHRRLTYRYRCRHRSRRGTWVMTMPQFYSPSQLFL